MVEEKIYDVEAIYKYMNVFIGSILVCSAATISAYNYIMRILGYLGR